MKSIFACLHVNGRFVAQISKVWLAYAVVGTCDLYPNSMRCDIWRKCACDNLHSQPATHLCIPTLWHDIIPIAVVRFHHSNCVPQLLITATQEVKFDFNELTEINWVMDALNWKQQIPDTKIDEICDLIFIHLCVVLCCVEMCTGI